MPRAVVQVALTLSCLVLFVGCVKKPQPPSFPREQIKRVGSTIAELAKRAPAASPAVDLEVVAIPANLVLPPTWSREATASASHEVAGSPPRTTTAARHRAGSPSPSHERGIRREESSTQTTEVTRTTHEPAHTIISDANQCGRVRGTAPQFTKVFQERCGECIDSGRRYQFESETMQGCMD